MGFLYGSNLSPEYEDCPPPRKGGLLPLNDGPPRGALPLPPDKTGGCGACGGPPLPRGFQLLLDPDPVAPLPINGGYGGLGPPPEDGPLPGAQG